jgi:hypothetical protein
VILLLLKNTTRTDRKCFWHGSMDTVLENNLSPIPYQMSRMLGCCCLKLMVKGFVGFNVRTGDRIETIAFTGHSGLAKFQVWIDSKRSGISVYSDFATLSQAEDFGKQKLNSI